MSSIKPPGGPGGIGTPPTPDGAAGPSGPSTGGPSFQDRVGAQRGASEASPAAGASGAATTTGAAAATTPQAVIADLRAGRISPNDAVTRLTDLAVQRSGAPPAMRATVEARLREMLSRDPLVQELMRQMGAAVDSNK